MMWYKLHNGGWCKFGETTLVACWDMYSWALPLQVEWYNNGEGTIKALTVKVLCMSLHWEHGRVPF